jgi:hypothetical protein
VQTTQTLDTVLPLAKSGDATYYKAHPFSFFFFSLPIFSMIHFSFSFLSNSFPSFITLLSLLTYTLISAKLFVRLLSVTLLLYKTFSVSLIASKVFFVFLYCFHPLFSSFLTLSFLSMTIPFPSSLSLLNFLCFPLSYLFNYS